MALRAAIPNSVETRPRDGRQRRCTIEVSRGVKCLRLFGNGAVDADRDRVDVRGVRHAREVAARVVRRARADQRLLLVVVAIRCGRDRQGTCKCTSRLCRMVRKPRSKCTMRRLSMARSTLYHENNEQPREHSAEAVAVFAFRSLRGQIRDHQGKRRGAAASGDTGLTNYYDKEIQEFRREIQKKLDKLDKNKRNKRTEEGTRPDDDPGDQSGRGARQSGDQTSGGADDHEPIFPQ